MTNNDWGTLINVGLKVLDKVLIDSGEDPIDVRVTRRYPSRYYNPQPAISINVFEQPLYHPIHSVRTTFIELVPLIRKIRQHPDRFRDGDWSMEYCGLESCIRIKYGIMDIMTVRFCDKRGRGCFGLESGFTFDEIDRVKIGGKNTYWRSNAKNLTAFRIDTFMDEIDWRQFGPYGLYASNFMMKMIEKNSK